MRYKTRTPRNLLAVIALAWAPSAFAQDYPRSPVIADIVIEETRDISFGDGDNFPMTWADDGKLYTMYCDGVGFRNAPINQWIKNGFAKLIGMPPEVQGRNIRSPDLEFKGGGRKGHKAWGWFASRACCMHWSATSRPMAPEPARSGPTTRGRAGSRRSGTGPKSAWQTG